MQTDPSLSSSGPLHVGSVAALWRYPVKSMMGEELNSCEVTDRGPARGPVGAENLCHLGRCSAERGPASSAGRAGLGPSGRAMIFGLQA